MPEPGHVPIRHSGISAGSDSRGGKDTINKGV